MAINAERSYGLTHPSGLGESDRREFRERRS